MYKYMCRFARHEISHKKHIGRNPDIEQKSGP